ncbi:hypothetical protein [Rhodohalobacter barkolensis]|uniref:Uncharacterized protein n=1 Tax=Rhodohalobacter barkolensis TaxID=2053187 RepID=A0A2N0VM16_9BACT|nr:hypothetical protein [Rhodohalobacter barkolensis]PKD45181.1 hypothetical protein CWD77_06960 [Rhodohalobacter barkolensis]
MTINQKVWLISFIIVLVCILAALLIYIYTGQFVLALFIAPPIIHWILKRRQNRDTGNRF